MMIVAEVTPEDKDVLDALPLGLSEYAAREFDRWKDILPTMVSRSAGVWQLRSDTGKLVMLLGVYAPSLIGNKPEVWLLAGEGLEEVYPKRLRKLFPLLVQMFPLMQVNVEETFEEGLRFAKFFGFTERSRFDLDGKRWIVLEN